MKENESKRQHWGESVKGRVSSDYKAHAGGGDGLPRLPLGSCLDQEHSGTIHRDRFHGS